jgi:hypothetical protein
MKSVTWDLISEQITEPGERSVLFLNILDADHITFARQVLLSLSNITH